MNAKELCETYDGRDITLHFTTNGSAESTIMSISIIKPIDRLKYVSVYSFRFEDGCLVMYADAHTLVYNLLMNPVFEEDHE